MSLEEAAAPALSATEIAARTAPVCTENAIRVDDVTELLELAE